MSITSATNILTWLADGGLAFACASGLWSGVDKPEAQAKVFLFAPEARLGLRKNSLRVRTLVAEVILGPFNVLRGQSRQSDYLLAREGYRTGSAKGPNLGRLPAK